MNHLVTEILDFGKNGVSPHCSIVTWSGRDHNIATHTLLDFLDQAIFWDEFIYAVRDAETGMYSSEDTSIPDFSFNCFAVWFIGQSSSYSYIRIINNDTDEEKSFTFRQFWAAYRHIRDVRMLIGKKGGKSLIGTTIWSPFP